MLINTKNRHPDDHSTADDRHADDGAPAARAAVDGDVAAVIDKMPALIAYLDRDAVFRCANKLYQDHYGLGADEIIGQRLEAVIGSDAYGRAQPHFERALTGERVKFENQVAHSTEDQRYVQVEYIPHEKNGAVIGIYVLIVDITEQKKTALVVEHARDALEQRLQEGLRDLKASNTALQESEQKFRLIFEQGPLAITLRSMGGQLIMANNAYCDLLGYGEDELRALPMTQMMHPDEVEKLQKGIHQLQNEEVDKLDIERRVITKNGDVRWVHAVNSLVRNGDGKALYTISLMQDITARKNAEANLQASEERFRKIFEVGPMGMSLRALDGTLLAGNDAYFKMLGYTEEELRRIPVDDLQHPDDRTRGRQLSDKLASGGCETTGTERRFLRKNGETIWAQASATLVRDGSGDPLYVLGMFNDITEQKVTTEQLRVTRDQMKAVLDHSPDGILLKDMNGRYMVANRAQELWHAAPIGGLIGKTVEDFYPEEQAQKFAAQDFEVLASNEPRQFEHEVTFADGRPRVVELNKFPVRDGQGNIVGIGSINRDVTAHRRAEEQQRQSQRMEALGRLTGGVAHDFNNLLTVVLGNLELLEDEIGDNEQMMGLTERALGAVDRGAALVQRLLAFSRNQKLAPQVLSAGRVIQGTEDLLRRSVSEAVDVRLVVAQDLWPCEIDPTQLENALLNLAVNAGDAMADAGTLTVAAENIEVYEERGDVLPGQYVRISVTDTGEGMPPEVVAQAAEPFFTTKDIGRGTGLGLSMVHGFVNQSGGHMTIDSAVGQGTAISLYLPRTFKTGNVAAPTHVVEGLPRGDGEMVLIVEDEPMVRSLVASMVEQLGYKTAQAADGRQALSVLQQLPDLDLLLTDIVLPAGMNGQQVAEEVRHRRPGIGVVYMSGYTDDVFSRTKAADIAVPLLQKPFHRPQIANALRHALAAR